MRRRIWGSPALICRGRRRRVVSKARRRARTSRPLGDPTNAHGFRGASEHEVERRALARHATARGTFREQIERNTEALDAAETALRAALSPERHSFGPAGGRAVAGSNPVSPRDDLTQDSP